MSRSVFVASPEGLSGKSTVALGLVDLFSRRVGRVGVYRPIVNSGDEVDPVVALLIAHPGVDQSYDEATGVSYRQWHADTASALSTIVDKFGVLSAKYDALVV